MARLAFVVSAFAFYIGISVMLSLAGQASIDFDTDPGAPSVTGIFDTISFFFQGLTYSLDALPLWANLMLFAPLAVGFLYILAEMILSLIPG